MGWGVHILLIGKNTNLYIYIYREREREECPKNDPKHIESIQ